MRLFYDPASTTSRAVTLFVAGCGLDVELAYVGLAQGEHYAAGFAALNPNRQVPVLVDGDFVLTECSAILKYLAEAAGSPAYPAGAKARALVNSRMDWFNTGFAREAAYGLVYPMLMPDLRLGPPEVQAQAAHRARQATERLLDILDRDYIGASPYVCGQALTLADDLGVAYVTLLDIAGLDFAPWPNVSRWLATMRRREHFATTWAAFDGLLLALAPQPA